MIGMHENKAISLRRSLSIPVGVWLLAIAGAAASLGSFTPSAAANEPELEALSAAYEKEARPIVLQYCGRCHGEKRAEAEIDLKALETLADVRKHPKTWQKAREMLATEQMPPKDARQPSLEERARLLEWVRSYLKVEARARAGDPGPVTLRRLSNAEYTYTVRDLTGVESLDPAREFPADGAAGEGFTNTGNALAMSPALLSKYLEAAKGIAAHAELLPDGFRFRPYTTSRDGTDRLLAEIRAFYGRYVDAEGRVPLAKYLGALLEERERLASGATTIAAVAEAKGVNPRYLATLGAALDGQEPSLILDALRARWRAARSGEPPRAADAVSAEVASEVAAWQGALWRFNPVGHLKTWMAPATPIVSQVEARIKVPAAPEGEEVTVYLVASDAGDGREGDIVLWERPRLLAPGRPPLSLRDVRALASHLSATRARWFGATAKCLEAAAEAGSAEGAGANIEELARRHEVEPAALSAWLGYLGIGSGGPLRIDGHFATTIQRGSGYAFINGWGTNDTPNLVANSSDQHVRIPGNMPPHSLGIHPSPTLNACVGWQSPVAGALRVEGKVTHAHPECGNGVTWSIELRRGATRQRLAAGVAQGPTPVPFGPIEGLTVQKGDLVSILIGPRDGNHSCDLTNIELELSSEAGTVWKLSEDLASGAPEADILRGNPHADSHGNESVWHFYTEPVSGGAGAGPVIPAGSLLARWQSIGDATQRRELAVALERMLVSGLPKDPQSPDAALYRQLASLGGPLFAGARDEVGGGRPGAAPAEDAAETSSRSDKGSEPAKGNQAGEAQIQATTPARWGLDPAAFGRHPRGGDVDPESLCVEAPSVMEVRLPAGLVAGCELVTTGRLEPRSGAEGSVQLEATTAAPAEPPPARPLVPSRPIVVNEGSAARGRIESAMAGFRASFPAAFCYTRIVPVDEVVTLTLFHREDEHLQRLLLDEAERTRIDRLWEELHYVSRDAFALVDAFAQIREFATQDRPDMVEAFKEYVEPIERGAAHFRQLLLDSEPHHLDAVLELAARAYRRPLTEAETSELRALYRRLRGEQLPHEESIRLTLAKVLVSPPFLYRLETPGPGAAPMPVTDLELATRLSYFLWSSAPDAELLEMARSGRLHDPDVLVAQGRRMMDDPRVRRLALEFGCQWLGIRDFDEMNEKSERHFPTFNALRGDMLEEAARLFTDIFQRDGSVLDLLDADYTYLDEALAGHYGIPGVAGAQWRRVEGVQRYSRGGVLTLAATLAKQSGASRTSPILRGNWLMDVLLGEKLPKPPKGVPQLPDEATSTDGLTVRQLVERHTADPACRGCHRRIDPYGYALEAFDAIGRWRDKDLGDRPIDTRVETMDGTRFEGLAGLREYLLTKQRGAFVRQVSRKLLGYALGRATQLSDEPLLDEMEAALAAKDFHMRAAVETILRSRPFREIRGREAPPDE